MVENLMMWIWYTLAGAVAMAIILLLTPIKLQVTWAPEKRQMVIRYLGFGHTTDFAAGEKRVDWLGLRLSRGSIKSDADKKPRKTKIADRIKAEQSKVKSSRAIRFGVLFEHRRTIGRAVTRAFVGVVRILMSPEVRLLRLDIAAGTGNPAVTGMYYGWYHALRPAWAAERVVVNWRPVFDRAHFSASFDGRVRLRPWRPVCRTLRLVHELPKWGLYRLYKDLKNKEV